MSISFLANICGPTRELTVAFFDIPDGEPQRVAVKTEGSTVRLPDMKRDVRSLVYGRHRLLWNELALNKLHKKGGHVAQQGEA